MKGAFLGSVRLLLLAGWVLSSVWSGGTLVKMEVMLMRLRLMAFNCDSFVYELNESSISIHTHT